MQNVFNLQEVSETANNTTEKKKEKHVEVEICKEFTLKDPIKKSDGAIEIDLNNMTSNIDELEQTLAV